MPQGERGPQQRLRQRAGVAKPAMSGRCWAQVLVYIGPNFSPYANCSNERRYGYLTCRMHPAREDAARELLETLRAATKRLRRPPLNCPSPASDAAESNLKIVNPAVPVGLGGRSGVHPSDDRRALGGR